MESITVGDILKLSVTAKSKNLLKRPWPLTSLVVWLLFQFRNIKKETTSFYTLNMSEHERFKKLLFFENTTPSVKIILGYFTNVKIIMSLSITVDFKIIHTIPFPCPMTLS